MIRFTALGSLELTGDDGRPLLSVLSQPRRLALLAYLAVARPAGFHRRDTLTALFWPDADAEHARDALSQALRFLRRSLGDDAILGRGAEEVAVARERVCCDVTEMETGLDAGRREEALALYRGELLAGFNVSDAPEFERWLDDERAQLRGRVAGAAAALAAEAARVGNPSGAATWARRGAALEPFDEALHRQALEYLDAAGDRAGALQEHEAFRRRLREQLESEPAPETEAAVEAIRRRAAGAASQPREGPAAAVPPATGEVPPAPAVSRPAQVDTTHGRVSRRTVLTGIAALFVLGSAVAAAWLWLVPARRARPTPTGPVRIVVLPFENLGPAEDQYFTDGVSDELTTRLAAVRQLAVISRTSANQYRNTRKSVQQIGSELGVSYILEGAVRWARADSGGGQVRITPQLIRVSDDTHVWADSYDRELREIFAIQSEIARNVVDALNVTLGAREKVVLASRPTENMKAYDYFLQGEAVNGGDAAQLRRKLQLYQEAIRADPHFANAYLGLGAYSAVSFVMRLDVSRAPCDTADAALRHAEALAPDDPLVHFGRGYYYFGCVRDKDRALAEAYAAERLGMPRSRSAPLRAVVAMDRGRFLEAATLMEQAFYFDPKNAGAAYEAANNYAAAGRFADAARWYEHASAVDSTAVCSEDVAEIALLLTGRVDSARAALRRRSRSIPCDRPWFRDMYLDELARDYESALRRIPRSETLDLRGIILPAALLEAQLYTLMNRQGEARRSFERAVLVLEGRRRAASADLRLYAALGQAYAGLGRKNDALAAAARAVELLPMSLDADGGAPAVYWQARTLVLLGDRNAALDRLEQLRACRFSIVGSPFGATPVQLRLEPWWDPLRAEPRFQKLVQER